jgi:hypothetical protein
MLFHIKTTFTMRVQRKINICLIKQQSTKARDKIVGFQV